MKKSKYLENPQVQAQKKSVGARGGCVTGVMGVPACLYG